jgi:transcriptional regulator with GAF, ATPase, and Fis domain
LGIEQTGVLTDKQVTNCPLNRDKPCERLTVTKRVGASAPRPRQYTPTQNPGQPAISLEAVERRHILDVVEQTNWVIEGPNGPAKILNLHPNTLRSRMKKLGIKRP